MSTAATMQPVGQHGTLPQSTSSYHPVSGGSYYAEDREDDARLFYNPQPGDYEGQHQYSPQPGYATSSRVQNQSVPTTTNSGYRNNMTTSIPYHTRNYSAPADQYDGAPAPPPRISSQQQRSPPSTTNSTNQTRHGRHHEHETSNYGPSSYASPNSYPVDSSDRRRNDSSTRSAAQKSPEGTRQSSASKNRSPQAINASNANREAPVSKATAPPAPLVREYSEIINRVIVSDPQEDIQRMQARAASSVPASATGPEATGQTNAVSGAGETGGDDASRAAPRRQDFSKSSSRRKEVRFGEYMLGQTLGEGEFGKVKLGWKIDGSNQVAIKLIRRDSVANNPSRLPKIHREISILRDLSHPNIVRLHEVVETERHIGMILEYASGGELFDYILKQRYLQDDAAKQLFAQLISGVGYLHKRGIVHRDLKLENLMLDKNMNIIITDFGFANTFNPADVLSDETETHLGNRDFVRRNKLDRLDAHGMRRGDLMQTSCGSPCYAAPELVVSDSLYTGRKVDVWSCGVILYAMLCGYLPFDDDPANPEGDNINLLYKYITTTALTFPEYVSPDARDLLKRILVPDPRKRADLFEVARHSWLSEFHHKVSHITSSTTNLADVITNTVPTEPLPTSPASVTKSASFSETSRPGKASSSKAPANQTFENALAQDEDDMIPDFKERHRNRHTLQPEYVEPRTHTSRTPQATNSTPYYTPDPVIPSTQPSAATVSMTKPLPQSPPHQIVNDKIYEPTPPQPKMTTSTRSPREVAYSNGLESNIPGPISSSAPMLQQTARPTTQGSMTSTGGPVQTRSDLRLPSRGSYGQPVAPTVAATNVQGRVVQPTKTGRGYNISGPIPYHAAQYSIGQPTIQLMPPPPAGPVQAQKPAHHRRSSTLSGLSERIFGRSASTAKRNDEQRQKNGRKYPPTSMKDPFVEPQSRLSSESKRSFSWLTRKRSTDAESQTEKSSRRFSLIPSVSFRGMLGGSRDQLADTESSVGDEHSQTQLSRPVTGSTGQMQPVSSHDGQQDYRPVKVNNFSRPPQAQYRQAPQPSQAAVSRPSNDVYGGTGVFGAQDGSYQQPRQSGNQLQQTYTDGSSIAPRTSREAGRPGRNVLIKPNRKFNDAYGQEQGPSHHSGSSGAARRIQDFFRRRGRARADSGFR